MMSDMASGNIMQEWANYAVDTSQRTILFWDVMRKRGNNYLDHIKEGLPPVLVFDYEIILDGREMEKPVNYALAKITPPEGVVIDSKKRPVVVIDPRAGHGPGIGGSKRDSEIGKAFDDGHPVYFILFFSDPEPGQTLADVEKTEALFIQKVGELHPDVPEPAVIGNCQAGWAVAMLGADRPDLTGPMVINGSPLSYWSGVEGANVMRYRGGITGGAWVALFLSDLGGGIFDGAHLVSNFEDLNPANTLWNKQYNLYDKIDTEEKRFLDFEKWWGGFFTMTDEEMSFIVENLFIGDKLEKGDVTLDDQRTLSLKNLEDPMVVFASKGDNITPPQQALNWIANVYGTVDEIKRHKQVIVYRVHEKVGHLGIFVSASVANKEHQEIICGLDMLEFLQPGLYEMVIEEKEGVAGITDYNVSYQERDISDILAMDDGQEDERGFDTLARISEMNVNAYKTFVRPWMKMMVNENTAEMIRQLHPLRVQRYFFSDLNPMMWPLKPMAEYVRQNRRPLEGENRFKTFEKKMSTNISDSLESYREYRDSRQERIFYILYDNPYVRSMFKSGTTSGNGEAVTPEPAEDVEAAIKQDTALWMSKMEEGGFPEAAIRVMLAVSGADHAFDKREYQAAEKIVKRNPRLRFIKLEAFREKAKIQARILQTDLDLALKALPVMATTEKDRTEILEIARNIAAADEVIQDEEAKLLETIEGLLQV